METDQNNLPVEQKALTEDDVREIINSYLPSFVRRGSFTINGVPTSAGILLKSMSGTSTAASATNIDTVNISGLSATDKIVIYYIVSSITQPTAACSIYHVTDGVVLSGRIANGNSISGAGNGQTAAGQVILQKGNLNAVNYNSQTIDGTNGSASGSDDVGVLYNRTTSLTTNWTGNWTLALRHGAVTAGGTFNYSWQVYKIITLG